MEGVLRIAKFNIVPVEPCTKHENGAMLDTLQPELPINRYYYIPPHQVGRNSKNKKVQNGYVAMYHESNLIIIIEILVAIND